MSDLLRHAKLELERSKDERDPLSSRLALRQAAEKAWGHVVEQTTRQTRIAMTGPEAHKERKNVLYFLDRQAGTSLLRDYEELERRLHGDCFYENRCLVPEVEQAVQLAEEFPQKLQRALRRVGGR